MAWLIFPLASSSALKSSGAMGNPAASALVHFAAPGGRIDALRSQTARKAAARTPLVTVGLLGFVELAAAAVDHDQVTVVVVAMALIAWWPSMPPPTGSGTEETMSESQNKTRGLCGRERAAWWHRPGARGCCSRLAFFRSPSAGVREPVDDGGGLRVDGGVADVLGPDGGGREVGRDRGNLVQSSGTDPGNVVVEARRRRRWPRCRGWR